MSPELIIALLIFSAILFVITTLVLIKGLIPIKYSLLWYFIAFVLFAVAVFSPAVEFITHLAGFETMSNMVIGIILILLIFLTLSLTIIASHQQKKISLLIQELSLLKSQSKTTGKKTK